MDFSIMFDQIASGLFIVLLFAVPMAVGALLGEYFGWK